MDHHSQLDTERKHKDFSIIFKISVKEQYKVFIPFLSDNRDRQEILTDIGKKDLKEIL